MLREMASAIDMELQQRRRPELPGMFDHEILPWGKYKNRTFIETWRGDRRYCEWFAGLDVRRPGDEVERMRLFVAQRKDR